VCVCVCVVCVCVLCVCVVCVCCVCVLCVCVCVCVCGVHVGGWDVCVCVWVGQWGRVMLEIWSAPPPTPPANAFLRGYMAGKRRDEVQQFLRMTARKALD